MLWYMPNTLGAHPFDKNSGRTNASELKEWNDLCQEQSEVARYLPVELPIIIQALRDGEPFVDR